jgi:hypothetical protein
MAAGPADNPQLLEVFENIMPFSGRRLDLQIKHSSWNQGFY